MSEYTLTQDNGLGSFVLSGAPVPVTLTAQGPNRIKISLGDSGERPSYLEQKDKAPVSFRNSNGSSLGTENLRLALEPETSSLVLAGADGEDRLYISLQLDEQRARLRVRLALIGEQHFYGLGQSGERIDRLGISHRLYNSHINHGTGGDISIPLLLSNKGYGFFFDNPREAFIHSSNDYDKNRRIALDYETSPCSFDFYVLGGTTLRETLSEASALLGRPTMPPLWTLGYMQSTRHFESADELMSLARSLRDNNLPADGVILLSTYNEGKGWNRAVGRLDYEPTIIPDGKKTIADFRRENLRVISHEYPVVHDDEHGKEAREKGYVLDSGYANIPAEERGATSYHEGQRYIDFENKEAALWWWEKHKSLVDDGIEAWWLDGGEGPTDPKVLSRPGGDALHNRFDLFRQQAFAEGEARDNPNRRPYLLCRSGGAGMQRFGAGTWSGDINNTWATFEAQASVGLSMGMSGVPIWGTDIGGFYPSGEQTGELFTRWLQFGVFNPAFRGHGVLWRKHTPWHYGPETMDDCRKALELRYQLMPYTYSLAWQAHQSGLPYMRPLALNYPDDPQALDRSAEFLWGDDILVSPVTRDGARNWSVYLPSGIWYDFATGNSYEGGQSVVVDAPLDRIPIFVRAGGIVPMGPLVQHLVDYNPEQITLWAFAGADGQFDLYEDDGETNKYRDGAYAITPLKMSSDTRKVTVSIGTPAGDASLLPSNRNYVVKLRVSDKPASVTDDNGQKLASNYEDGYITIELGHAPATITVSM